MTKEQFIKLMTTDLPEAPAYFSRDAEINRTGAESLTGLPYAAELTGRGSLRRLAAQDSVVLDVRDAAEFGAGHVPGALNIGLGGQFASWAGSLIPITSPIVIVAESNEKVEEAQLRLARVGLENVQGYLKGGIKAWEKAGLDLDMVPQISVAELKELIDTQPDLQIIDVRRPAEYESGHAPRATSAPLAKLGDLLPRLNLKPNAQTAVICAGGYRSSAGTSILQQLGFKHLLNVTGGTKAWIDAGYEVEMPA